jgi:hypothetical protein
MELSVLGSPGDLFPLGGYTFSFTPLFSVDNTAAPGVFTLHSFGLTCGPAGRHTVTRAHFISILRWLKSPSHLLRYSA